MIGKCRWCGCLFEKHSNEKYCSCYCRKQARLESKRNYINGRNLRDKHYNTRIKNLTTLGSKGTSSDVKVKKSFREEHNSIVSEKRRLGLI